MRLLLLPFAWFYGMVVKVRNVLFDLKILPVERFPIPVIGIGNLSVGGTGKTPFTEYLIRLLKDEYRVAVLSRGYKRKTQGFVLASLNSDASEIGDEPCQIKQKFPDVIVAVDSDRRHGIRQLLALPESRRPQIVLLDDALQHRYVLPSLTILLTDYEHLYYDDYLLPAGSLRESSKGVSRADIVVVTKCRQETQPADIRLIEKKMSLKTHQRLYFSGVRYHRLEPLFSKSAFDQADHILLITGIAHPQQLIAWMKSRFPQLHVCSFPDHHAFSPSDLRYIDHIYQQMPATSRKIVCTEKDAMRLKYLDFLSEHWKSDLYYLPISVEFLQGQGDAFDTSILQHVRSIIHHQQQNDEN